MSDVAARVFERGVRSKKAQDDGNLFGSERDSFPRGENHVEIERNIRRSHLFCAANVLAGHDIGCSVPAPPEFVGPPATDNEGNLLLW